jgi:hypothetical protein
LLELLVRLLPLMLAAAANPVVITMVVLLLTAPERPLLRAWSFLAGFALVLVVGGILFLTIFHNNTATFGPGGHLYAWIDIGFGAVMLVAAVVTIRRSGSGDASSRLLNRVGAVACLGLGAVMMATDTSAIAAYVPLLHEISNSDLQRRDHWIVLAISDLVILAPIAAPALIRVIAPERAGTVLAAIRSFLDRHGSQIAAAVFVALGAYLLVRGIGRL